MPNSAPKNVTNIKEGRLRSIKPKRHEPYCQHLSLKVCQKIRMLECNKCQSLIEPFDYCWKLATKSEHIEISIGYMKKELAELQQQKDSLKKEIRNLKQRRKRANDK